MIKVCFKIGSSTFLNETDREKFVKFICKLKNKYKDIQIIIVSSGAIGFSKIKFKNNFEICKKEALASIGQIDMMLKYKYLFLKEKIGVGQILLGKQDFENEETKNNLRNTINSLIEMNHLPILNENDSVYIDEIKFGDNDNLSAYSCVNFDFDLLFMISDIPCLYENFNEKNQKRVEIVSQEDIEKLSNDIKIMKLENMELEEL
jgi:glutamate 5-kinase